VFDYEDSKDKETEDLDNKFIRLGRFKQVPSEQFKETDPVPGLAPAVSVHKESKRVKETTSHSEPATHTSSHADLESEHLLDEFNY
jgi:hypothetical protein